MFGRQKMYKAGVADTMQANADFMEKQQAAINHMRNEISQGVQLGVAMENALNALRGCYTGLSQYLSEKEKSVLYKLHSSMDIRDLEKSEKYLLMAILYQLANDQKDSLTEHQQLYLRNIQKYLGISNPQIQADLDVVSDIDSLEVQKAFLECVLEFFYLQDGNEISNSQERFLSFFSVNEKHATLIEERVAHIYEIVGPAGLADKYDFVPDKAMSESDTGDYDPKASQALSDTTDGSSQESREDVKSSVEHEDISEESQYNGNAASSAESMQDSSYVYKKETNQPTRASRTKRVRKYYGVRLQDAIRWGWMDATFAVEKKINDFHRNRIQRSVDESRAIKEKLRSMDNTATENDEDTK